MDEGGSCGRQMASVKGGRFSARDVFISAERQVWTPEVRSGSLTCSPCHVVRAHSHNYGCNGCVCAQLLVDDVKHARASSTFAEPRFADSQFAHSIIVTLFWRLDFRWHRATRRKDKTSLELPSALPAGRCKHFCRRTRNVRATSPRDSSEGGNSSQRGSRAARAGV